MESQEDLFYSVSRILSPPSHNDAVLLLLYARTHNVNGALSDRWRPEDAEPESGPRGFRRFETGAGERRKREYMEEGRGSQEETKRGRREYRAAREGIGECFLHVGLLLIGNV